MKQLLIFAIWGAFAGAVIAQPSATATTTVVATRGDTTGQITMASIKAYVGGGTVTSVDVSGGTSGLTYTGGPITSSGTITLASGTLDEPFGGTGNSSYTLGDMLWASSTTALSKLGLGGDNTHMASNGTAPYWATWAIGTTNAAIGISRSGSVETLNLPDASATFRGTVSTGTQTMAGNKTWSGTSTFTGLATTNGGILANSVSSSVAAANIQGVMSSAVSAITATATLDHTSNYVSVAPAAATTISLPSCTSTISGWEYTIHRTNANAFAVIIDPASTEAFIGGGTTKLLYGLDTQVTCKCLFTGGTGAWLLKRQ